MSTRDLLMFCLGANLACIWFVVMMMIASRRSRKRLTWEQGMVDALSAARKNLDAAAKRGDREAYEQYEAEFWGISAELDNHWKKK